MLRKHFLRNYTGFKTKLADLTALMSLDMTQPKLHCQSSRSSARAIASGMHFWLLLCVSNSSLGGRKPPCHWISELSNCFYPPAQSLSPKANETIPWRCEHSAVNSSSQQTEWPWLQSITDTLTAHFSKQKALTIPGIPECPENTGTSSYWRSHFFPQQAKSIAGSWAEYLILQSEEQMILKTQKIADVLCDVHIISQKSDSRETRSNQCKLKA